MQSMKHINKMIYIFGIFRFSASFCSWSDYVYELGVCDCMKTICFRTYIKTASARGESGPDALGSDDPDVHATGDVGYPLRYVSRLTPWPRQLDYNSEELIIMMLYIPIGWQLQRNLVYIIL